MNCQLKFVSFFLRPADSAISLHQHDCYEIVYYLSGKGRTNISGTAYDYGPEQFAIIEPGCGHDEYRQTETQVLFIGLKYESAAIRLSNGIYRDGARQPILRLLQQIREEMRAHQALYESKMNLLAGEILIELARLAPAGEAPRAGDLAYAIHYLDENCSQPVSLKALADMTGYSYHRFRHLFKERTGQSPVSYLIAKRLEKAGALLRQTNLPIARIAQDCGFYNESQLSAMFRRTFKESPGRYRRS